jgi:large repetitive protein
LAIPGASGSLSFAQQLIVDTTAPLVEITPPAQLYGYLNGSMLFTVAVSDTHLSSSILTGSDVSLLRTGTANATVSVNDIDLTHKTVTLSNISGRGTLAVQIAAGTAIDLSGNLADGSVSQTRTVSNLVRSTATTVGTWHSVP